MLRWQMPRRQPNKDCSAKIIADGQAPVHADAAWSMREQSLQVSSKAPKSSSAAPTIQRA
jgi:hypothetical protein